MAEVKELASRPGYGKVTDRIIDYIRIYGHATAAEISTYLDHDLRAVSKLLKDANKDLPRIKKRVYVHEWAFFADGKRRYPRPVYAIGDKPDAVKPKRDMAAAKKRYNDRLRMQSTMNFVFNMGAIAKQRSVRRSK